VRGGWEQPPVYSPGKPILQRLENSKPAPLDMGTISSGFQGTGLTQSPNLIDSSKPPPSNYAYAFQGAPLTPSAHRRQGS